MRHELIMLKYDDMIEDAEGQVLAFRYHGVRGYTSRVAQVCRFEAYESFIGISCVY